MVKSAAELLGIMTSLSLLQQQAEAFGLSPDSLALGDFSAERDRLA